jgi:hypothetical protein
MPILRRVLESALGSGGVKLPVFEPVMQRIARSEHPDTSGGSFR